MEDKLASSSFKAEYKRFLKSESGDPLALKAEVERRAATDLKR